MPKAFSPQDHYFHLAKKRGLRARSAFKLEEILQKFPNLLPKNARILDLGAAPGSFLQILRQKAGSEATLIGVDLQAIEPFPKEKNIHLVQGDVFSKEIAQEISTFGQGKLDLITSDLAPSTSGVRDVDQWKSIELNARVLEFCQKFLKPGGNLIAKIFVGEDFQEFWKDSFQPKFQKAVQYKSQACRDRSFEIYLVGIGYKK